MRWQPAYHALLKWMHILGDASRSAATRKKAIVAVARQLAVDLWRLFTGQTTAEKLGLIYLPEADAA
jgi:transposase